MGWLKLLIIIAVFSILTFNVAAGKIPFLEKIRQYGDKPELKPNDACSLRCAAVKNTCVSKCREFAYAVCNNNCMRQSSKCRQDCRGLKLLEPRLKQSKRVKNLFLKFRFS